jgi:hypothetical protein
VTNQRNKILKEQHRFTEMETTLNVKGKKLQLYRDIRKGLGEKRASLCALRNDSGYASDDSKVVDIKQSILEYKCAAEEARNELKPAGEAAEAFLKSTRDARDATEAALKNKMEAGEDAELPGVGTSGNDNEIGVARCANNDDNYNSPYKDFDSNTVVQ